MLRPAEERNMHCLVKYILTNPQKYAILYTK